jgi:hypothetical protein
MRGGFQEGRPHFLHGTYINGFYETWPIPYGEKAFGFAKTGQTMINVPDGKIIRLYVDDEPFTLDRATLDHYERALDMKSGTYERETLWETPSGKHVRIRTTRFVSFTERHVAAVRYEVTVLNARAPIVVASELADHRAIDAKAVREDLAAGVAPPTHEDDPRLARTFKDEVLVLEEMETHDKRVLMGHFTRSSRMTMGCGMDHVVETENDYTVASSREDQSGPCRLQHRRRAGQAVRAVQIRDVSHVAQRAGVGAARAVGADAGSRDPAGIRSPAGGSTRVRRRFLAAERHPDLRPADQPAPATVPAVESVPDAPGDRARRERRRAGEGSDRAGVRGTLLLGHGDLLSPVPHLHRPAHRAKPPEIPARHARQGARTRHGAQPARRPLSLADDQRRRGERLLRRRHGAISHQRGNRLFDQEVRRSHRRLRNSCASTARKCSSKPRGSGSTWASSRSPEREIRHPQRHRAPTNTPPSSTTTPTRT